MNTKFVSLVTVFAFTLFSLPLRSDVSEELHDIAVEANLSSTPTEISLLAKVDAELEDDDYATPQGKEVTKQSDEDKRAARKDLALKIGLAIAAVGVAVAALIIVSNNNGHHYLKK